MREFNVLHRIFRQSAEPQKGVVIGPGDDMAYVRLSGRNLLAAVDQIVDGRHVNLAVTPLELVGRKAITRSLSDIAAMAASPVATLVAATLPAEFGEQRANELFDAMQATAKQYECPLVGGDLGFHGDPQHPLICAVTVLAEPWPELNGRVIERRGAQRGDVVCVTGPLGGSLTSDGLGRHLTFEPRIDEARALAIHLGERLHAMIDISDGLGRDASHVAELSEVQIVLDAARIPCNPGCNWRRALSDGEDYELCFTAQGSVAAHIGGVDVYQVGEVAARAPGDPRLVIVREGANVIDASNMGWQHGA